VQSAASETETEKNCGQCGSANPPTAKFCCQCGQPLKKGEETEEVPPPPPPPARLDSAIWNPNAAAAWSIMLTPVFGAVLHGLNWQSLGQPERAKRSFLWAAGVGGLLFVELFSISLLQIRWMFAIITLAAWFFSEGISQINIVRSKYGVRYSRKSWRVPLIAAFVILGLHGLIARYRIEQYEENPSGNILDHFEPGAL
jgi:hypothetical protein